MKCRVLLLFFIVVSVLEAAACTSAIVSGKLTSNGRPILWKHRDTSDLNNKVARIEYDGKIPFVALFNSSDKECREAWIGMNESGFAIMNTASYNLKNDTVSDMDKEGLLMSIALSECRTVDDFATLLDSLPKPLGVEANFGVIDAYGGAAYFETNNWEYERFNVDDTEEGYLIRTNYSKSGRKGEGYGYIREQNAEHLLAPYIANHSVTPAVFTEVLSRSFYHSLIDKDFEHDTVEWVVDRDFIPRRISSASVAIEGVVASENTTDAVMWTVLGYPPCGIVYPVTVDSVPEELQADPQTGMAPACDRANALKSEVFPMEKDNGENYLNINALFNEEGTGISQKCKEKSINIYRERGIVLR